MDIAIIDYGMGNLHSVLKSAEKAREMANVSANVFLTQQPEKIAQADKVIFPGQGAMPDCMKSLQQSGLDDAVQYALRHKPFFGICVGAQLLFERSEEGDTAGLSWFAGEVKRFESNQYGRQGEKLKVPHMGWNTVCQTKNHPIFQGVEQNARFYFVHSYYFAPQNSEIILGESEYPNPFACVVGKDNVFATQFHAEKSHDNGLTLLKNFMLWDGQF